jgi:hypothetical protein
MTDAKPYTTAEVEEAYAESDLDWNRLRATVAALDAARAEVGAARGVVAMLVTARMMVWPQHDAAGRTEEQIFENARAWLAAQGQPAPAPTPDPWALLEAVVDAWGEQGSEGGEVGAVVERIEAALAARGGGR